MNLAKNPGLFLWFYSVLFFFIYFCFPFVSLFFFYLSLPSVMKYYLTFYYHPCLDLPCSDSLDQILISYLHSCSLSVFGIFFLFFRFCKGSCVIVGSLCFQCELCM
ncbi:hypothetical protein BDZ91DRAFT_267444 [Kalaharituber pfeilii]|nr:hypothetical protein BDZ91DRAFT_267444 [Kalaharituber pfeilii]